MRLWDGFKNGKRLAPGLAMAGKRNPWGKSEGGGDGSDAPGGGDVPAEPSGGQRARSRRSGEIMARGDHEPRIPRQPLPIC